MKRIFPHCIVHLFILFYLPAFSQDSSKWDEAKSEITLKQLDDILTQSITLKQNCLFSDTVLQPNLDTIITELASFKMAIRRKNKYAVQYEDDYLYYNEQLNYLTSSTNPDSLNEVINDIKTDMLIKSLKTRDLSDSSLGPGGESTNYGMINLRVRVFSDSIEGPLDGFEIFIKRGTYIPSKDSVRIPQLTNNAVMRISPGNKTIVAWKGKLTGYAKIPVTGKPESEVTCDIKLK